MSEPPKNTYLYQPLDSKRGDIRLLHLLPGHFDERIRCRISKHVLSVRHNEWEPLDNYEALSYTWGAWDNAQTIELIGDACAGKEDSLSDSFRNLKLKNSARERTWAFFVTSNLFVALRRLRRTNKTRTLWIDAVCINQQDLHEKGNQLAMMDRIYKQASRVLVWLGDTSVKLSRPQRETGFAEEPALAKHQIPALIEATENTSPCWWDRAWVYQEYALSTRRPLFCFGPFEACLDEQQDRMKIEEHLPDGIHLHLGPAVGLLYTKMGHLERSVRQIHVKCRRVPLYSLLTSISAANATNPRDYVYSLRGLISNEEATNIPPDYSVDTTVVYSRATYASILHDVEYQDGDLSILWLVRFGRCRPDGLPSWAVDFRELTFDSSFSDTLYERRKGIEWIPDQQQHPARPPLEEGCLTLRGFFFDRIGPMEPRDGPEPDEYLESIHFNQNEEEFFRYLKKDPYTVLQYKQKPFHIKRRQNAGRQQRCLGKVETRRSKGHWKWCMRLFKIWSQSFSPGTKVPSRLKQEWLDYLSRLRVSPELYADSNNDRDDDCAFFATASGFLGLGPATMEEGDVIVLFCSSRAPAALRPRGDTYEFLGFAYVHGIMNGELLERKTKLSKEDVVLC
ncbi:heterokaryon incompatibility protein-domain-containing protein [Leptodontidium sp. MPI-SDFR-AT-0119]|nr:heterokaryon incompatibility protein-domain-containing protein [Leptodontidium sp. MPI-SDFR-AT-0119]